MSRNADEIIDEWLVMDARNGRQASMQALALRWHRRLLGHAFRRTGHPEGAAEAVQEAWIAIVRGLRSLEDPTHFRAWVYRIVDHKAIDWVRERSQKRDRDRSLTENGQGVDLDALGAATPQRSATDSDAHEEKIEHLRRCLRRLPDEPRSLLGMYYVDGLSVAEIARALSLPEGTVKSRLFHARKQLRAAFEEIP